MKLFIQNIFIILIAFSKLSGQDFDCVGIEDGNTICLGFDAVDQNAGSFDITYNSLHPISGFQFNLSEIEILSGESALGSVYTIQSSGFVMAFLESMYLPPSENGILASIYFTSGPEVTTCLSNAIIAGVGGLSFEIDLPECLPIPEADTDCTGEYGGDAVVDECGACEGSEFNCNEAGACSCSGCMDEASCNFNETALVNDGTCWQPSEYCSCADGAGAVADCNDVCNGSSTLDQCGQCDGNGWDFCDDNENGITNYDEWDYGAYDVNIADVQGDQGGWVFVSFHRSFLDDEPLDDRSSEDYYVQIQNDDIWVTVASSPTYGEEYYSVLAPTLTDSSGVSDGLLNFRIIANMDAGNFVSDTAQGYSVDNIHPTTPSDVSASHTGNDITVNWDYVLEEDFNYHEITGLWDNAYSTENNLEFNLSYHHDEERIQSVDINDNKSKYSESVMSILLHAGANLVSINVESEDTDISSVLSSLGNNITGAIGEGMAANNMEGNWMGSLDEITSCEAYWLIVNEADILLVTGYPTDRTIPCELHAGANLIGYPYRYATSIEEALPEGIGCDISGIIGEGVAATCIDGNWMGSLYEAGLEGSYGYWFIAEEAMEITFNGCDEQECASLSRQSQILSTVPDGFEYKQSTEQAFYFIEDIENIIVNDWILAYNGDNVIGARQWTGDIIDVPAMGSDGSDYTKSYMDAGSMPIFKILRGDELIDLEGDIPAFENNQLYMVSSLIEAVTLPESFSLDRAYPNPFNPTTTLSFAIPVDSDVSLSIYNLQGREVSTIIDANMDAGYHSVVWNADSHASGVYFVKMVAGDFVNTQKLMLVK